MSDIVDAIRQSLVSNGFDQEAYDDLVTHSGGAMTDRECGVVVAWVLLAEVDRLAVEKARLRTALARVAGSATGSDWHHPPFINARLVLSEVPRARPG